ncbi:MAG: MarR family transcriptional regulator [Desulfobacterales bacterium]|nr:MarR family transcriptional regulator [Desulfobacterales bacterium]
MTTKDREQSAGQALHDLFREVFALQAVLAGLMDQVHLEAGLSTSQIKIMRVLSRMTSATVPDVAADLKVSRQFVQTVCNHLHRLGYLEFKDNPRHKRSKRLFITAPGRQALDQARRKENAVIAKTLPHISTAEVARACKLLQSIRSALSLLPENT